MDPPAATIEALLEAVEVTLHRRPRLGIDPTLGLRLPPGSVSLVYVLEGTVTARTVREAEHVPQPLTPRRIAGGDPDPVALVAGDLLLVSGRRSVGLVSDDDARVVHTTMELADDSEYLVSLLPDLAHIADFDTHEPAATALISHLGEDLDESVTETPRSGSDEDTIVCRTMARTVLASAIRSWWRRGCAPDGWPSRSNDPYLDRVVAAIEADPGRDWSVQALAAIGAMSRTVFSERFRAAYGRSPAGYVTEVRMRAARDLLAADWSVSQVSRELGYGSDEGFSRAFRRRFGATPSVWRASAR